MKPSLQTKKLESTSGHEKFANNYKSKAAHSSEEDNEEDEDDDETATIHTPTNNAHNANTTTHTDDIENENENEHENDEDDQHQQLKRPLSPSLKGSGDTVPVVLKPKRTANLENLIGNLKVRKMNNTQESKSDSKSGAKMNSLYVEVAASLSSDCSRSTPPLSSSSPSSVSPSSLSIAPDSPVQSHVSSSLSSSSSSLANAGSGGSLSSLSSANKSRYTMVPKFRWMVDASSASVATHPGATGKPCENSF